MKPSMLDRAIAQISPRWGLRRLSHRVAFEQFDLHLRKYEAAKTTRRTDGWVATGTSANAEIGPQNARIRNRARDLVRNNPYGAKCVRTLVANIVGQGIVPMMPSGDTSAKREIMDQWQRFSDNIDPEGLTDFYGLQAQVLRAVAESGECLVQKLARRSDSGLDVPLQYRVLEADYLDTSKSAPVADGNVAVQGIEFNEQGQRVAYWLFDQHPGDNYPMIRRNYTSQRVPVDQILHVFDRQRPGQIRGVSWLAPIVLELRDFGDYKDAEAMRKKISACFSAFVKKSGGGQPPFGQSETDQAGRRIEHMEPGIVQYLDFDEDVTLAVPPGSEGYEEYSRVQLHGIAAGPGVLYEQLTGDYSQVNFSSSRAAKLEQWPTIDIWQQQMMVPQMCRPIWRAVDEMLVSTGDRARLAGRAEWIPPPRHWADADKQVNKAEREVRAGFKDGRRTIVELTGKDPDLVLDDIQSWNAAIDLRELILDSDPRNTTRSGAASGQDTETTGEQDGQRSAARPAHAKPRGNGHAGHA